MRRITAAIMITITCIASVSCGNRADIAGEWRIVSAGGTEIEASEAPPTLTFNVETGSIHAYTGVNIVNGEYVYEGRRLTIKGLGMTMMAGPEEDMALERKILETFENVRTVREGTSGEIEFADEEGEVIMTLARR